VQWIHGRYLKNRDWWSYTRSSDTSWHWKKLLKVRDRFKTYPVDVYKVNEGYTWLLQNPTIPKWSKFIWTRLSIPRHSLAAWLFMHQRLPVLHRLNNHTTLSSTTCILCQQYSETQEHLFFRCSYATKLWEGVLKDWQVNIQLIGMEEFIHSLTKLHMSRRKRALFYAMVNAVIYNIWTARNRKMFNNIAYHTDDALKEIKRQVTLRVLQLHQTTHHYSSCLDILRSK